LRDEHPEFPVAEVTVRQYVRKRKQELGGRVAFVPQSYDWGQEAQVDWFEAANGVNTGAWAPEGGFRHHADRQWAGLYRMIARKLPGL
jgi:hypothetical protein